MPNRQRTPGDVPGAPQYGQGRMMEQASRQIPRTPPQPPQARTQRPTPVPLTAPTAFPDEPVTAGAPFGPGPGAASMGQQLLADNERLVKYLPSLEAMANSPEASGVLRGFVQYLKGISQ